MKKRLVSLMMTFVFLFTLIEPFDVVKAKENQEIEVQGNDLSNITVPEGMPQISDFNKNTEYLKIDNVSPEKNLNKEYPNDEFNVRVDFYKEVVNDGVPDGITYMNWQLISNNYRIYYVFVKGGNGGYLYWYDEDDKSDTGLHALLGDNNKYRDISHVEIFFKKEESNPPQQTGSYKVIKTKDENGDGDSEDANEGAHEGITFSLIEQVEGGKSYDRQTNENGEALFENIPVGDYKLYEMPIREYRSNLVNGTDVKIEADKTNEISVLNTRNMAFIEVRKSIRDNGLNKHPNIPIILKQVDRVIDTIDTDENGIAKFENIAPGKYIIEEGQSGTNYVNNLPYEVEVIGNAPVALEVVNIETEPDKGVLQVLKLKEIPNQVKKEYFPNVEFKIYSSPSGEQVGLPAITDVSGYAVFRNLPPGNYTLKETLPNDYTTDLSDTNIYKVEAGKITTVMVTNTQKNGENPPQKGKLKVIKKIVSGVPHSQVGFRLIKKQETPRLMGGLSENNIYFTNSEGVVIFENLEYGEYLLEEVDPDGFMTKIEENDTSSMNITIDSPEKTINVKNSIILNDGEEFVSGKIKGFKYYDNNQNGRWDEGEERLQNWRIELYKVLSNGGEELFRYTTTDTNGDYFFEDVLPGEYYVREKIEDKTKNWRMTQPVESYGYHITVPSINMPTFRNMDWYESRYLSSTTNLEKLMPETVFVAEGRIGIDGPADYELDISQNGEIKDQDEYIWPNNGTPVAFRLLYDKNSGKITYTIGSNFKDESLKRTLEYTLNHPIDKCTDLIIRTQSTNSKTGIVLNNLMINGEPLDKYASAAELGPGLILIRTDCLFNGDGIFVLEGNSLMFWGDAKPQRSQLAYQIKVGNVVSEANIPKLAFGNTYDSIIVDPELPDLAVTKTDGGSTVKPGEKVTYTVSVTNIGKEAANNIYVYELLPSYTSFVNESGYNEGWQPENYQYRSSFVKNKTQIEQQARYYYYIKSLGVGESKNLLVTVRLNNKDNIPDNIKQILNTVTVEIDRKESNYENNTATDTTPIEFTVTPPQPPQPPTPPTPSTVVRYPDLTISKTDGNITAKPGDEVEYRIIVVNNGDAAAFNVKVYEKLPEHTSIVEGRNSKWKLENEKYVYEIGTLSKDETKEIKFVVRVDSNIPDTIKKIINNVEVKTTSTEYRSNNNTASDDTPIINPTVEIVSPLLEVIKTDDGITAINGESIIYKITAVNKGNGKAEEVKLFEKVPEYTTFDEAVNSGWVKSGDGYVFEIGTLEAGKSKTVEFKVVVDESITYSINKINNTVVLSAKGLDDIDASDDTDIIISTPPVLPETGRTNNVDIFAGIFAVILLAAGVLIKKIK